MDQEVMLVIAEATAKWWLWQNPLALHTYAGKLRKGCLGTEGNGTSQQKSMTTLELLVKIQTLLKLGTSMQRSRILQSHHKHTIPAGFTLQVAVWEVHSLGTLAIV
jgi:hypothetical protein